MRNTDINDRGPGHHARDASFRTLWVAVVLATLAFLSTRPASTRPERLAFNAAVMALFPSRVTLQVTPGNARVEWGSMLAINAHLVGTRPSDLAQLEWGDGRDWRTADMATDDDGQFYYRLDSITAAFHYRILAGAVASPTYSVTIATGTAPTFRN